MTKLKKMAALKNFSAGKETPIDKTARIVRNIVDEEAEQRQVKMARLRSDRLAGEVVAPSDEAKATAEQAPEDAYIKAVE